MRIGLLIALLSFGLLGVAPFGSRPVAIVYGGPGVLPGPDDTLERAVYVAEMAGFEAVIVTEPVDLKLLSRARVWIQPGGPNLSADQHMNANGMSRQVREFVSKGGGYVGFCGGAFSAVNNLGLIKGSAWNYDEWTGKIPILWMGHTRYMHFEHGPYILLSGNKAEAVGLYADDYVTAARGTYGKGRVFISGVHPEASWGWEPAEDPDGLDTDLAIYMIQWVDPG